MNTFLYIFGYIVLGVITAIAIEKFTECEKSEAIGWGIFWPLVWIFGPIFLLCGLCFAGIEKLGDLWDDLERKHKAKKH